ASLSLSKVEDFSIQMFIALSIHFHDHLPYSKTYHSTRLCDKLLHIHIVVCGGLDQAGLDQYIPYRHEKVNDGLSQNRPLIGDPMELGKAEEIAERIRQRIMDETFQAGAKIASERDLSTEFGVSRMTIRHAIEILEGEGLVARYPGRGTFVGSIRERVVIDKGREIQNKLEKSLITESELRMSGSFLTDMKRLGRKPQVQFLEQPALVPATTEVASHLSIGKGTLVFKRYRLQIADNLPYRLIESYYPSDLFGELLTTDIGDKPLFIWLQERHGLRVSRAQEMVIARLATPRERQLLRISTSAPVVTLDRIVWTETNRSVEYAHIIAVAALYAFTYEYAIPEWNK
ncbi:MAG TPA: GntR family transcriptional regulator, partial [Ktedonobacteraceae bacterium]|nr:GntR family transcriptional regulator [Ktedonobacteraceae bacterium]